MHFLQFHNLAGGWVAFFAQDVKRVVQTPFTAPDGSSGFVTQVTFGDRESVVVKEPYDEVMGKLVAAWGGEV